MVKFDRSKLAETHSRRTKGFYNSFKSGLEYEAGDFLRAREGRFGFVSRYESERLQYSYEGTYKPDFVLSFDTGYKIYIETKGYMDNDARRKMASVRRANPELDIRFVFARDHKLRKDMPMTYTKWATKVGFPSAVKTIPEEWLQSPEETKCQMYHQPSGPTISPLTTSEVEDIDLQIDGIG